MSLSDFVLISKIGEGAYSSVHKAKRSSDGVIYALKKVRMSNLSEKEKENALNEVRLLASISSDYIIKYRQAFFDTKSNTLCIVMEFADGGDLEKVIEKKKRTMSWFDQKDIWIMMRNVLNGIVVLHEKNIIHRDLKSANIFLSEGKYKVADLNVSKLMKKDLAYTQTGTPYYASPEVWQDKPYQLKSDIWSFGCILYELCALKPPFSGNSMEGLFRKVMKGIYPKIPSLYSDRLGKIIDLCLKIDPKKRPTAKQLLKFIQDQPTEVVHRQKTSSINLLSTIKVPKNSAIWKTQLPKSDYQTMSEKPSSDQVSHPKYGQISHNRLREIVRIKNEEAFVGRKQKKVNPQNGPLSIRNQIDRSLLQNSDANRNKKSVSQNHPGVYSGIPGLPRIKIHSQPNEKVSDLLKKLKEEERRRYDYNRPSWWG